MVICCQEKSRKQQTVLLYVSSLTHAIKFWLRWFCWLYNCCKLYSQKWEADLKKNSCVCVYFIYASTVYFSRDCVIHVGFCATTEAILNVILSYCFVPPTGNRTDVIIHVNPWKNQCKPWGILYKKRDKKNYFYNFYFPPR